MRVLAAATAILLAACGNGVGSSGPARSAAAAGLFLPACAVGARPQSELHLAGIPPLVPTGPLVRCLLDASISGSAYDSGYDGSIQLVDGRELHLYERRGDRPVKAGASQTLRSGTRDVNGVTWTWSVLENGATTLETITRGVYVELDLPGDESQVDTLAATARDLVPVESLARPPARDICGALGVTLGAATVAAAFDSSAGAVTRWQEQPATADAPRLSGSPWRAHPPAEPVALCYLDGDFGPPKGPPPGAGATTTALPNWSRVVYLVGVDRRPIGLIFGWQDRIPIKDPGL